MRAPTFLFFIVVNPLYPPLSPSPPPPPLGFSPYGKASFLLSPLPTHSPPPLEAPFDDLPAKTLVPPPPLKQSLLQHPQFFFLLTTCTAQFFLFSRTVAARDSHGMSPRFLMCIFWFQSYSPPFFPLHLSENPPLCFFPTFCLLSTATPPLWPPRYGVPLQHIHFPPLCVTLEVNSPPPLIPFSPDLTPRLFPPIFLTPSSFRVPMTLFSPLFFPPSIFCLPLFLGIFPASSGDFHGRSPPSSPFLAFPPFFFHPPPPP